MKGIIEWFTRIGVAANLLMVFIIFGGLMSALTLPQLTLLSVLHDMMGPVPLQFTMLIPNLPQLFKFPLKLVSHSWVLATCTMVGGLLIVVWSLT